MGTVGMNDRTLLDALKRHVLARPNAPAYRCGDKVLSFADVERETSQIANALIALGVGRHDRVACLTRHHAECMLLVLAACKIGAVCMPVNWRLSPPEVSYIVNHGRARLLMVDEAFLDAVMSDGDAAAAAEDLLIVCTEGDRGWTSSFANWYAPFSSYFDAVPAVSDDSALQLYSSGTTGRPKGIVLSHGNLLSTSRHVSREWGFNEHSVHGNPLPVFHVAGMTMLLYTLYTGGLSCTYSDFDPTGFIESIGRHGITHTFLVPAMLQFMLQSPAAATGDYHTLKLIAYGGSPISERVLQDAMKVFQCDFLQVYGMTEVSGPATFLYPSDHQVEGSDLLRSAGKAMGGARIRIVDLATCEDLPEGKVGEIWVESERNLKEYWRDEDATAKAFPEGRNERGGWLRTGDCAYIKNGYVYIVDRLKDMIISGGENIYPAEVENALMMHPAVNDCAIIGVPDQRWGEAVKACVVAKPGVDVSEDELISWCRTRLAHYKCPKSVDFVEALPRNPSGKILKRILREPYWQGKERAVN